MLTIPIQIPIIWGFLAAYALWYVTAAKHNVPITLDEAEVIWRIHKQNTSCTCRKWHLESDRKGRILGFKCDCGFKYRQQKHILSRTPNYAAQKLKTNSRFSTTSSTKHDHSSGLSRMNRKS